MNQNIWGPHLWFSLHTISFAYPLKPTQEDKDNYKNFFLNLKHVIPCSVCKKNYKRHIEEHPIDGFLDTKKSLVYWVIDMHNMVNAEIGKKILSYDVVIKKYENVYKKNMKLESELDFDILNSSRKNNFDYNYFIYGLFLIFLILLIINFIYLLGKSSRNK
jgi:hypothetical protein